MSDYYETIFIQEQSRVTSYFIGELVVECCAHES